MDGSLRGTFTGLAMHHGPQHLYRAALEASAFGLRWIIEVMEEHGLSVKRLVATGGLPHHNPLLMQIYADVLGRPIVIHHSKQGPALGAAILGVLAAGKTRSGFKSAEAAVRSMATIAGNKPLQVRPVQKTHRQYEEPYRRYRALAGLLDPVSTRRSLHHVGCQ
jgi:L-ribulokinase